MRKLIFILYASSILILMASCGTNQQAINTQDTQGKSITTTDTQQTDSKNTNEPIGLLLDKEIKTNYYSISVPKSWSYEELRNGSLSFIKENTEIGGLYIQPYYKDVKDPVNALLPNHAEIIDSTKLTGFFTETQEIKLVTTEPAVSGDSSSKNWIHIFFIKDKEVIYEIFFNTKFIDENNILKIAKSFKLL